MSLFRDSLRSCLAAASFLAFGFCTATSSSAQGLISNGTLIALEGDPVPDAAGNPLPGITLGGDVGQERTFLEPQIDENGTVVFRSKLYTSGPNPTPLLDVSGEAIFYGTERSNLRLALRGGEPVPGGQGTVSADVFLGTSPFRDRVRLSSTGSVLVHSWLRDPLLAPPFDVVGSAFIGGPPDALNVLVRTGDVAPGTGGATLARLIPEWPSGSNSSGSIWFRGSLDLGTGIPATETGTLVGIWSGPPNALELVVRSGNLLPGNSGLFAAELELFPSVARAINDSGSLLFNTFLSTTLGTAPATYNTDEILCVHSPGLGSQIVAREGSPVPGLPGITYRSFGLGQPQWYYLEVNERSLIRSGEVLFRVQLDGTVAPPNDE